jgi:hypothetical protein
MTEEQIVEEHTTESPEENMDTISTEPVEENKELPKSIYGKYATLGSNAIWQSPSGTINLNAFTGNISYKITKDTPEADIRAVIKATDFGLITLKEKPTSAEPNNGDNWNMPSSLTSEAYRRVDMAGKPEFDEIIKHTTSVSLLKEMISIEQNNRDREDVLKLLKKQLMELSN